MRYVRIWTAMLFALIVAAACADGPTTPDSARAESAPPSRDDIIRLGPVVVVGQPQCDPWTDPNWCDGDDDGGQCMSSSDPGSAEFDYVSSCPGTGGPGSGPGGGGGGGGGGSGGPVGPSADPSKQIQDDTDSACPPCDDREPEPSEEQKMQELLPLVQCTDAQGALTQMLGDGSLRVYTSGNNLYGVWNSDTQQIYINWSKHYDSTGALNTAELIDTMVHEAVHKLLGHVNGQQSSETHGTEFRNKMSSCGFPQP
jgi:hypothetical protein